MNTSSTFRNLPRGNAPRQGLFAAIIAISFLLHTVILLQNSLSYQSIARESQGNIILQQLVQGAQPYLLPKDTVALALLINQYTQHQEIANIKIYTADNNILASGGNAPSRFGKVFHTDIIQNQQLIGRLEITMTQLNPGEVMRTQWIYFVLSLIIHCVLWLIYRAAARPTYTYNPRQLNKNAVDTIYTDSTSHSTSALQQAIAAQGIADQEPFAKASTPPQTDTTTVSIPETAKQSQNVEVQTVVNIAYTDPSGLLETLSPNIETSYYALSQLLLEQAVVAINSLMPNGLTTARITKPFHLHGAQVGFTGSSTEIIEYATQLAILYNQLSEAVYQHHRQNHRFALFTQCAVVEQQPQGKSASEIAAQLIAQAPKNGVLVHVLQQHMKNLNRDYIFYATKHLALDAHFYAANILEIIDDGLKHSLEQARDLILEHKQR